MDLGACGYKSIQHGRVCDIYTAQGGANKNANQLIEFPSTCARSL